MVLARLTNGKWIFGITEENVKRLKEGKPLVKDLSEHGGTDCIAIVYGQTEKDILDEMERKTGQSLPTPLVEADSAVKQ